MSVMEFLKKHIDDAIRVTAVLAVCALMAAFILAFRAGKLPHSADGDAFDTIYALGEGSDAE